MDEETEKLFNIILSDKEKAKAILKHFGARALIDELASRKHLVVTQKDNVFTVVFKVK